MRSDPPRLRDDPASPPELRELMAHGRPPPRMDSATRAASAAAIAGLGGASTAAASATVASATAASGVKLWLVVGGLAVTSLVGAGVAVTTVGSEPSGLAGTPTERAPVADSTAVSRPPDPAPAQSGPPSVERAAPPLEGPQTQEPPSPDASEGTVSRSAASRPRPRARPRSDADGRATSTAPASRSDGLVVEAGLLEQARRSLATDPARALAQAELHAREHSQGQLAAEREVIAIDALRRLGRPGEARRRARRLLERAPSGIYAERARAVLRELDEGAGGD